MKVRVKVQPGGLLNLQPWPEVGETLDLPDAVAEGMIAAGNLEAVKPEKKAKPKKVEKATASKANVETRKKS